MSAEREQWLRKRRERDQARREAKLSEEQREAKLQRKRTRQRERLAAETDYQREEILERVSTL